MKRVLPDRKVGLFYKKGGMEISADDPDFADAFRQALSPDIPARNLDRLERYAQAVLRDLSLPITLSGLIDLEVPDATLPANAQIAKDILERVRVARMHLESDERQDALNCGLILGTLYAQLGANMAYERPVAARERSDKNLKRPTHAVRDREIEDKLATMSATRAALALGITERQIRNRIPKGRRAELARKRK